MKQTLVALAILSAFSVAGAQTSANSNSSAASSPVVTSGNSGAESLSSSTSNPYNGASQAVQINTYSPERQRVDSTSTARVINEGSTTQNVNYSGSQTVKNVPGIAMSGPASGPCTGSSGGIGIAGPGFGVGGNMAKVDDGCTVRENTRTLGQVYQALDAADPMKSEAREAMLRGMRALDSMNAKIAGDYPSAQPKVATAQPAMVVSPVNSKYEPTDPYVRARLGLPKL